MRVGALFCSLLWAHCKSQLWTKPAEPCNYIILLALRWVTHKPKKALQGELRGQCKRDIIFSDYQWLDFCYLYLKVRVTQKKSEKWNMNRIVLVSHFLLRENREEKRQTQCGDGALEIRDIHYSCHEILWKSLNSTAIAQEILPTFIQNAFKKSNHCCFIFRAHTYTHKAYHNLRHKEILFKGKLIPR